MKNRVQRKNGDGKEDAVEIRFTIPRTEYEAIKELCDDYRLEVAEAARSEIGRVLSNGTDDEDVMCALLFDCNELRRNGGLSAGFLAWLEKQENNDKAAELPAREAALKGREA